MLQLNPTTLRPTDLRRGDVLLLDPGSDPKNVSAMVTQLDGSPYSHAVILDSVGPDFRTLSANYAHDGLVDGIDAVPLADFVGDAAGENLREARVLRPRRGGEAAADRAAEYVEHTATTGPQPYPYPGDVSTFAWDHLLVSALAAACRHFEPDAGFRKFGTYVVTGLSKLMLPYDPCTVGPATFVEPKQLEWDCCYFVDHCFCVAGFPLGLTESDPSPRRPKQMVLEFLGLLWDEIKDRFDGDDPVPEPHDDEPREGEQRDFMRVAGSIARRLDVSVPQLVRIGLDTEPSERLWPPFASPRLLIECPALDDMGVLPRGVFSGR